MSSNVIVQRKISQFSCQSFYCYFYCLPENLVQVLWQADVICALLIVLCICSPYRMAYLAQSLVMKNGETCDKDGDICASEVSITDNDDSGSIVAQRTEKVYVLIFVFLIQLLHLIWLD